MFYDGEYSRSKGRTNESSATRDTLFDNGIEALLERCPQIEQLTLLPADDGQRCRVVFSFPPRKRRTLRFDVPP